MDYTVHQMDDFESDQILLVDDDFDQLLVISMFLERKGFDVICAGSAKEAAHILATKSISCVVCDIMMPKITGLQFVTRVRTAKSFSEVPIILLTSVENDNLEFEGYRRGANLFCRKREASKLLPEQIRFLAT